jgi:hypothetical protein
MLILGNDVPLLTGTILALVSRRLLAERWHGYWSELIAVLRRVYRDVFGKMGKRQTLLEHRSAVRWPLDNELVVPFDVCARWCPAGPVLVQATRSRVDLVLCKLAYLWIMESQAHVLPPFLDRCTPPVESLVSGRVLVH